MGRSIGGNAGRPTNRRRISTALALAAAVVLLFAVVGVVSAGSFVAGKVSGSSATPTPTVKPPTTSALAVQDIRRAGAQATAIIRQARAASDAIVKSATTKARRQASSIVSSARRTAPVAAPTPAPTTPPVAPLASTPVASGAASTVPGSTFGSAGSSTGASSLPNTNSGAIVGGSASTTQAPDLQGLPASWLVVGYNATFSSATGGVGTISVINRSSKLFSGTAMVKYQNGQSASAAFSGLLPGQAVVLRLYGATYPGGAYHIVMSGLH